MVEMVQVSIFVLAFLAFLSVAPAILGEIELAIVRFFKS